MYGNYSYGKRHLGRVIPTHDRVIKIGNPPPHPTIFVGPVTVAQLKKQVEVDQIKLEKKMQQRKCLAEKNQNETREVSKTLLSCTNEDKENIACGEKSASAKPLSSNNFQLPEGNSFDSRDSSNCSNHTYTLENSDSHSPSQALNSTYDKFEETENFNLQIDITQNSTFVHERKSVANKSNFRNYRQNRQDSMASDVYYNVNKTTDISQLTDASTIVNNTNRSVLISFDNLKLDDECGNVTNMSMRPYKDSPVAKILMDDKFSRDYRSPVKNKRQSSSVVKNADRNEPTTPKSVKDRKSVSRNQPENVSVTPKSTSTRKSISKNKGQSVPPTPVSTPSRKSKTKERSLPPTPVSTPARKSIAKQKDDMPTTPKSTQIRKSFSKDIEEIQSALEDPTITLRTAPSVKRKLSHMAEEDSLNLSRNNSPVVRKSMTLNKENISVRKTPGKMSSTWVTELKAENYLINSSFRDSTDSCGNRSTPDVFQKTSNEMWKPKMENLPEKESTTPFKSKLPKLKKTPNKYHYIASPVSKYIHRGEGIKSMSKLRHSACVNELTAKSKSETKDKNSESKNKSCKIPQRCVSVQRKLDLPKVVKKSEIPSKVSSHSSFVSGISTLKN